MTKENKSEYKAIGVMAGSSMDGLDVVEVSFSKNQNWTFELIQSHTFSYEDELLDRLTVSDAISVQEQQALDVSFGKWIGEQINSLETTDVEFVAVHGHTVVHDPQKGISWQLGSGEVISEKTEIKTITSFRSEDVKLGGQGAPLVPVGDFELFSQFDACLNLGGIANVSVKSEKMAWDVCPCNQVLNFFASKLNRTYDEGGKLAAQGDYDLQWAKQLQSISFFENLPPKSLPNKFLQIDLLNQIDAVNGLATYSHFVANQIIHDLRLYLNPNSKVLVTGGGAMNTYLISLLNEKAEGIEFVIPNLEIINFKEAIVFAFLGALKIREEVNVLASVTGASRNSSSGEIHFPK